MQPLHCSTSLGKALYSLQSSNQFKRWLLQSFYIYTFRFEVYMVSILLLLLSRHNLSAPQGKTDLYFAKYHKAGSLPGHRVFTFG